MEQSLFDGNKNGIVVSGVQGVTINANRIVHHRARLSSAMHLGGVTNTSVTNNQLEDNFRGIFTVGAREALIRANTVIGQGLIAGAGEDASGIVCLGYNGVTRDACTITGNTVRRASSSGITAHDVASIVIADNVLEDSGHRGVYLRGSSENDVRNNTVRGSGVAAPMQTDAIEVALGSHRNVVSLNTIYASSTMRTPIGVGPGCSGNDVRQNTVYRGPRS